MDVSRTDEVVERLNILEAENGRMKRRLNRLRVVVCALALALLVPVAMGAFQVPQQVAAREFVVVDPQTNKARIVLGVNNQGAALIDINDIEGRRHIQLQSLFGGQGGMYIYDPNGQVVKTLP